MRRPSVALLALSLRLAAGVAGASPAAAAASSAESLAQAVAEVSTQGCFGIISGTVATPSIQKPDDIANAERIMTSLGLTFGISQHVMNDLGPSATGMLSGAAMGSRSLHKGVVVLAYGGDKPVCRVILLADPGVDVSETVALTLYKSGWMPIPIILSRLAQPTSYAFMRRDPSGARYMMDLTTMAGASPESRIRSIITTIRLPPDAKSPDGS